MRAAYFAKIGKQDLNEWIAQVANSFMTDPKWQPQYMQDPPLVMGTFIFPKYLEDYPDYTANNIAAPHGWTLEDFACAKLPQYKIKAPEHLLDGMVVCLELKNNGNHRYFPTVVGLNVVIKIF